MPVRAELMQILRFAQNDRLSREFPWAFGPPEEMKVERKSLAMKNGDTYKKTEQVNRVFAT